MLTQKMHSVNSSLCPEKVLFRNFSIKNQKHSLKEPLFVSEFYIWWILKNKTKNKQKLAFTTVTRGMVVKRNVLLPHGSTVLKFQLFSSGFLQTTKKNS